MHFIRVHGRVVPIKDKGEMEKGKAAKAAVGVAAGTFAASRVPVKSATPQLAKARSFMRRTESINFRAVTNVKSSMAVADKMGFARTYPQDSIKTARATPASFKKFKASGQKFLIKPNDDAMGVMKSFFTNGDKVPKTALTGKNVIQKKLKLTGEYRVTSAAGKVTSITHRRLPGSESPVGAFLPVIKGRKEVKNFVETALKRGKIHPHTTGLLGIDVARTKQGLKMIEANVGPGDLMNPIKNIKAKTHLLGRLPRGAALGLSALAGIAAYKFLRRKKQDGSG